MNKKKGVVGLVGAGPGDPGLITLRGYQLLKKADVVLVDALVNPQILKGLKGKIIYAGKRGPGALHGSEHNTPQEEINQTLVRWAKRGARVVRLKGGDPFVFGRGSEEMQALWKENIDVEIVPGVTSAIAAPAVAGIPVTDRRWASQVTFVTGHGQARTRGTDPVAPLVDWKNMSPNGTLVILMGVASWKNIKRKLLAAGFPPDFPVAAVESGTNVNQRVIITTLKKSFFDFSVSKLMSPAVIVLGDVVRLSPYFSQKKRWKPLAGKRVVVTRPLKQNRDVVNQLQDMGAEVLVSPAIRVQPLSGKIHLDGKRWDHIIFLSANAVRHFSPLRKEFPFLKSVTAFCVGDQTKQVAIKQKWLVEKLPRRFSSGHLLKHMGSVRGKRFLVPRVQGAPREFIDELLKRGAFVQPIEVYKNIAIPPSKEMKREILKGVHAVIFTSASTARSFLIHFSGPEKTRIFKKAKAVSMGPQTSKAIRSQGVHSILEARNATIKNLIQTLEHL
ncbi:MAG: Siroheme synthase [Elusimicrobia bacterium]|nr:Siroheme synthase [Elusimicrobiota bacterium]